MVEAAKLARAIGLPIVVVKSSADHGSTATTMPPSVSAS
jgi:hypothetical protein